MLSSVLRSSKGQMNRCNVPRGKVAIAHAIAPQPWPWLCLVRSADCRE